MRLLVESRPFGDHPIRDWRRGTLDGPSAPRRPPTSGRRGRKPNSLEDQAARHCGYEMDDEQPAWPGSLCVHSDDYRSGSPRNMSHRQTLCVTKTRSQDPS
jgi:hypothetical protein